jgi:hypothetical protein
MQVEFLATGVSGEKKVKTTRRKKAVDQGMKNAHRSRRIYCYVEYASWPSIYLLGWIIFPARVL